MLEMGLKEVPARTNTSQKIEKVLFAKITRSLARAVH